ncbi:MAG: cytochrome P450 [Actinomycetota bacterium]|nr:cytochrome P450 [Actinomycetota bacterium]
MTIATTRPYDDHDVSSLDFWTITAEERDATFAVLRREAPVSWQRPAEGGAVRFNSDDPGFWGVVRHADVVRVSRHPELFCSGRGVMLEDVPDEILDAASSFLPMDAPRHTSMRRLVSSAFTPRRVKTLEDRIAGQARALVDRLLAEGEGDFVETIAKPLPAWTFAEMMGVADDDRERVTGLANNMVSWNDPEVLDGRDGLTLLFETLVDLYGTAVAMAERRREHATDDIFGALVAADVGGERLSDEEIASFLVLLSVAANDTTRQSISHGMRALCRFPDQRALLAGDVAHRIDAAVEEIVRWATPVMTFRRTATADTELAGQPIAEGDKVVMFYASANRDETVFPDPWRLDITRAPNEHVGFGGGGPHYCLGASLARTMLRAIFTELVTRAPTLSVGEPTLLVGNFIHGVSHLPYQL